MKTIRLLFEQWQGGDYDTPYAGVIYPFGAKLLAWLAPESNAPLIEVPVKPYDGEKSAITRGVVWKDAIISQLRSAKNILDQHTPDRIITFGGDCLVSQAPFAYLNERYDGKIGLLWIDAHPDISTPAETARSHAMVLGNLLGGGDPELAREVKKTFIADQVLYVGLNDMLPAESVIVNQYGIKSIPAADVANNSQTVLEWMKQNEFEHIVIHVDIDVLDPHTFPSQLTTQIEIDTFKGKMTIPQLTRLLNDVDAESTVVGISFAEYMPWDALHLKRMFDSFSFMK